MDYDATEIPLSYDRGRDHGPENLQLCLATMRAHAAHTGDTPVCEPIDVLVFR
jgi:hypothetical protein